MRAVVYVSARARAAPAMRSRSVRVIDHAHQALAQRAMVVRRDIKRGSAPHFAQARDIAQNERASGERGSRARKARTARSARAVHRSRRAQTRCGKTLGRKLAECMTPCDSRTPPPGCELEPATTHRPGQLRRDRFERGQVFGRVPQPARGEDERLLCARRVTLRAAPIGQNDAFACITVVLDAAYAAWRGSERRPVDARASPSRTAAR